MGGLNYIMNIFSSSSPLALFEETTMAACPSKDRGKPYKDVFLVGLSLGPLPQVLGVISDLKKTLTQQAEPPAAEVVEMLNQQAGVLAAAQEADATRAKLAHIYVAIDVADFSSLDGGVVEASFIHLVIPAWPKGLKVACKEEYLRLERDERTGRWLRAEWDGSWKRSEREILPPFLVNNLLQNEYHPGKAIVWSAALKLRAEQVLEDMKLTHGEKWSAKVNCHTFADEFLKTLKLEWPKERYKSSDFPPVVVEAAMRLQHSMAQTPGGR